MWMVWVACKNFISNHFSGNISFKMTYLKENLKTIKNK